MPLPKEISMPNDDLFRLIQSKIESLGDEAAGLISAFVSNGLDFWIVGGIVRDAILDQPSRDLDIAADFDPIPFARDFADLHGLGFAILDDTRRVARIVKNDHPRFTIDIAKLQGGSIAEDLANRDFTINAIACYIRDGGYEIADPLGGLDDIRKGVIRPCSTHCIKDDPVRILRAHRFSNHFNYALTSDLNELINNALELLISVPAERALQELVLVLGHPSSHISISNMASDGSLFMLFPELKQSVGVGQNDWHHLDVFAHSMETLRALERDFLSTAPEWLKPFEEMIRGDLETEVSFGISRGTVLKFAALLHDCAKPKCRAVDEKGKVTFYGHEKEGEVFAKAAAGRLKAPNSVIDGIGKLIVNHLRPFNAISEGVITRRGMYRYHRDLGEWGVAGVIHALADAEAAKGPAVTGARRESERVAALETLRYIESAQSAKAARREPLITGHDVMAELGLAPGPLVGKILEAIREADAVGEVTNREDAMELAKSITGK